MRERAADVKAERDGLRREADVLRETLRAVTASLRERNEQTHREERSYTDANAGHARMVGTLINPTLAHGGIVLVETFYSERRDVEAIYLDDWRLRLQRLIDGGCSSAWIWAEQSIIESMTREVSRRNERAA